MNKKLALLLIPMLLIPLASFAYAHFSDQVMKKYKLKVGSIEADVVYFHVDNVTMLDANQNDIIFGDELNITIFENPETCQWIVQIIADPVTGGFLLNTTMKIHNSGHLPWRLAWEVMWNQTMDDPCWTYEPEQTMADFPLYPDGPWSWDMNVYEEYPAGVLSGPLNPTQVKYEPSHNACITQHVNFIQPDPSVPGEVTWQKEWECTWMVIWIRFTAIEPYEDIISDESWTYP